jgi:hypothetical protein
MHPFACRSRARMCGPPSFIRVLMILFTLLFLHAALLQVLPTPYSLDVVVSVKRDEQIAVATNVTFPSTTALDGNLTVSGIDLTKISGILLCFKPVVGRLTR